MDATARYALIKENLAEVLDAPIIENILAEGRNPKIYWGKYRDHGPPALRLLRARRQDRPVPGGGVRGDDPAGRHPRLPRQPEGADRAGGAPRDLLPLLHHRDAAGRRRLDREAQVRPRVLLPDQPRVHHGPLQAVRRHLEHDAKKAGAEIVKQTANAPLSGLLYPILQVLDEQYLDVDAQFGGLDQRKLFTASKEWLPKLGYKQRAHLMNPMVPGLQGGKMSSSDENSKIDLLDSPELVTKKIRKAEAVPKEPEGNGILAFAEFVLLPVAALKGKREFVVSRERDGLEPLVYSDVKQMHEDYKQDILTPQLLKAATTKALTELLAPIQKAYQESTEWQEITLKAYPPPPAPEKKVKKVKDRGTGFPGPKKGGANPKADIVVPQVDTKEQEKIVNETSA
ncbi:tyrosyl-tRNA synthetase- class Ib [Apiospora phragmitis]|uniref:tyrosine--tRNA ligase n=1 Tax=Apiospora phragmitis TaxID=2905665 RepID=A0ABR1WUP1_9PEZI